MSFILIFFIFRLPLFVQGQSEGNTDSLKVKQKKGAIKRFEQYIFKIACSMNRIKLIFIVCMLCSYSLLSTAQAPSKTEIAQSSDSLAKNNNKNSWDRFGFDFDLVYYHLSQSSLSSSFIGLQWGFSYTLKPLQFYTISSLFFKKNVILMGGFGLRFYVKKSKNQKLKWYLQSDLTNWRYFREEDFVIVTHALCLDYLIFPEDDNLDSSLFLEIGITTADDKSYIDYSESRLAVGLRF